MDKCSDLLPDYYSFVTVVELAQNAGQHNAVMAGLNQAQGNVLIRYMG